MTKFMGHYLEPGIFTLSYEGYVNMKKYYDKKIIYYQYRYLLFLNFSIDKLYNMY